jgi:hypothetical protein
MPLNIGLEMMYGNISLKCAAFVKVIFCRMRTRTWGLYEMYI